MWVGGFCTTRQKGIILTLGSIRQIPMEEKLPHCGTIISFEKKLNLEDTFKIAEKIFGEW